jgi:hypothetical protein
MERERHMEEQRQYPRLSCYLDIICDGRIKGTVSKDISLYGMFIKTDPSLFKKEEEFYITINLPTRPLPIEIKSKVMRIADDGVGVKFVDMTTFDLENLKECINFFKDVIQTTPQVQDSILKQHGNIV